VLAHIMGQPVCSGPLFGLDSILGRLYALDLQLWHNGRPGDFLGLPIQNLNYLTIVYHKIFLLYNMIFK
jgi:hypothetical protein